MRMFAIASPFLALVTGCASGPEAPDPDAVPAGPVVVVPIAYVQIVHGGTQEQMVENTRAVADAFKSEGFTIEIQQVPSKKTSSDPPYAYVGLQADAVPYCLSGIVMVRNHPSRQTFEVRQRAYQGTMKLSMNECAREIAKKAATRIHAK